MGLVYENVMKIQNTKLEGIETLHPQLLKLHTAAEHWNVVSYSHATNQKVSHVCVQQTQLAAHFTSALCRHATACLNADWMWCVDRLEYGAISWTKDYIYQGRFILEGLAVNSCQVANGNYCEKLATNTWPLAAVSGNHIITERWHTH